MTKSNQKRNKRIAILCAGLDDVQRGYEIHTRALFDSLVKENISDLDFVLYKRIGYKKKNEKLLNTPGRKSKIVTKLKKYRGNNLYWESVFFAVKFVLITVLFRRRFFKIIIIEPDVAKVISLSKRFLPGTPKILYTHGVSRDPENYINTADIIHEVNYENYLKAVSAADVFDARKIHLVPHFLANWKVAFSPDEKILLRKKYNISTEKVVLSVGILSRKSKNTEYLIKEIAKLDDNWTLVLCGACFEDDLLDLGNQLLSERFVHTEVPHRRIKEIYALADIFVLSSINEGFGIVLLEAMASGLPVIAHQRELYEWVLTGKETLVDMGKENALLEYIKNRVDDVWVKNQRARSIKLYSERYTWDAVKDEYFKMFYA